MEGLRQLDDPLIATMKLAERQLAVETIGQHRFSTRPPACGLAWQPIRPFAPSVWCASKEQVDLLAAISPLVTRLLGRQLHGHGRTPFVGGQVGDLIHQLPDRRRDVRCHEVAVSKWDLQRPSYDFANGRIYRSLEQHEFVFLGNRSGISIIAMNLERLGDFGPKCPLGVCPSTDDLKLSRTQYIRPMPGTDVVHCVDILTARMRHCDGGAPPRARARHRGAVGHRPDHRQPAARRGRRAADRPLTRPAPPAHLRPTICRKLNNLPRQEVQNVPRLILTFAHTGTRIAVTPLVFEA